MFGRFTVHIDIFKRKNSRLEEKSVCALTQMPNFAVMLQQFPLRSFVRLNIIIGFLFSALVGISLFNLNYCYIEIIYRFLQSLIFTNLVGIGNMFLFAWMSNSQKRNKKFPKYRIYLYSYTGVVITWFLIVCFYSLITGAVWEGEDGTIKPYILAVLSLSLFNTIILIVHWLIIFQYRHAHHEIEKLQLKANISDTKNLLLRQQIQPHFLFNALNTVKSLYKHDSKLGEEYLVHLANFLRVSVSNPKEHIASVNQELSFCLNYLKMQKIRFGSSIEYNIQLNEDVLQNGYIPYFSIQPLIENVLKHNELTEEKPIKIWIYEQHGFIVVRNNLQENPHKEPSAGNGLYNLKERYRLLGEDKIRITSDHTFFTVYLKILER
ncbi:sensor histidine kinase [Sphingobacterium sp. HSC-15S19]|uniref:sensor histidine kinase n=1 Tax=Sphingobacterium TaxID=28453 RepID=UPI003D258FB4